MKNLGRSTASTLIFTGLVLALAGCTVYPTYPEPVYASTAAPAVIYSPPAPAPIPAPVYAYPRPYVVYPYGPTLNFNFHDRYRYHPRR